MDERDLGKRLQAARQAAGLTQQKLCQRANLSFSTLTKIERGAIKSPSIFTIQAIANALDVSLDELVGQAGGKTGRQLQTTKSGSKFIYFDVNGCLVRFFQGAFTRLSHEANVTPDVVETVFWHYNDDVCRGTMSLSDFNAKLAEELKLDHVDWQEYYIEAIEPILPMHELLKWASEHYRIGLLTNIMPGLLNAVRRNHKIPALPYDAIVDSSEVAAIKPEVKIYEIAAVRSGCQPSEIMLVDDSRVNLMAAERLGWHVLWFDDSRPEESVDRVRAALEPIN